MRPAERHNGLAVAMPATRRRFPAIFANDLLTAAIMVGDDRSLDPAHVGFAVAASPLRPVELLRMMFPGGSRRTVPAIRHRQEGFQHLAEKAIGRVFRRPFVILVVRTLVRSAVSSGRGHGQPQGNRHDRYGDALNRAFCYGFHHSSPSNGRFSHWGAGGLRNIHAMYM